MRIDHAGSPLAVSFGRGTRRSGRTGGGFALPDDEPGQAAEAGQEAPALAGLTCLAPTEAAAVTASAADPAPADHMAARQGRALLDALSRLQLAGMGAGGAQARAALSELALALPRAVDPRLDAVLRGIAQRAAIELARAG